MTRIRLPPRPYRLEVAPAVKADLLAFHRDVTTAFWVLVQELRDDQRKLVALAGQGEPAIEDFFDVLRIREYMRGRPSRELWRLKSYDLERNGHRVRFIYVVFEPSRLIIILAAVPRRWNYATEDDLGKRIASDHDRYAEKYG